MQIKKIYNNNIAMVKNEAGDEVILVGKGIVFGLKKGDEIQAEKAEKKFELKGETKHKFEKMIQDTPIDYILVSEEIIAYFKEHSTKALNDGIYVTLTDHIANTIERIRMGIDFDMTMLLNVKSLYREEYKLALHAIEMLRNAFHLHIDDNEANFITLHIVNAELTSNMMEIYTITSILESINTIVLQSFQVDVQDNYDFDRFLIHCCFFVQRIVNAEAGVHHSTANQAIFQMMKEQSVQQYACVNQIAEMLEKKYAYSVNDEEKLYLLIHLNKLTKDSV